MHPSEKRGSNCSVLGLLRSRMPSVTLRLAQSASQFFLTAQHSSSFLLLLPARTKPDGANADHRRAAAGAQTLEPGSHRPRVLFSQPFCLLTASGNRLRSRKPFWGFGWSSFIPPQFAAFCFPWHSWTFDSSGGIRALLLLHLRLQWSRQLVFNKVFLFVSKSQTALISQG